MSRDSRVSSPRKYAPRNAATYFPAKKLVFHTVGAAISRHYDFDQGQNFISSTSARKKNNFKIIPLVVVSKTIYSPADATLSLR
jgi:hypothetical protein